MDTVGASKFWLSQETRNLQKSIFQTDAYVLADTGLLELIIYSD